jgi:Domain of unknown function (DUF4922)
MTGRAEELFERQLRKWPQLATGVEGLERATTRPLRIGWFEVFVRHIPHRIVSTRAAVDAASVAARPCFLCAENMPAEEEGVPFDDEFTIYCNPFPIVENHLTIAHREHRPQRIAEWRGAMLALAAALPGYFVVYNGPRCGASAPDHMHFQAGSRRLFPIEKDIAGSPEITAAEYGRNVLVLRGRDQALLAAQIERAIGLIAEVTASREEPLINLAAWAEKGEWTVYLFPRSKHRPRVFHTGELTVSPASIDLCGIFVVPLERDFQKISGDAIFEIFREVTLPDDQFREVAAALGDSR